MNTTRLIIVSVGGQGNIFLSQILGKAALIKNVPVKISEIHGMAQRGGIVESSVIFGDVHSSIISDGEADILLGFEPAESLRALVKCNKKTVIITNTSQLPPFTANIGLGEYPDIDYALQYIKSRVSRLFSFNATSLAIQAGDIMSLNMVMTGALISLNLLPVSSKNLTDAIKNITKSHAVDINLKAFELGANCINQFKTQDR